MDKAQARRTLLISAASLAVALIVLGLKFVAFTITGSIALFSDALESIVNVVTAIVALIAVRLAQKPADAQLPYGYYKAEYFSAVFVGVIIIVAALLIFQEAFQGFMNPRLPDMSLPGMGVAVLATVLNVGWALVLIRRGRAVRSPALEADGKHLMTDVMSTIGVLVGLLLVLVTGWAVLDSVLAALVAVNILWSGWGVVRSSVGGLMDVAVPHDTQDLIRATIATHADGAIEAHDIRTRQAGAVIFVDFHLVVPGSLSVDAAHEICDRIEAALRQSVKGVKIHIHVEPDDKAKREGVVLI